MRIIADYRRWGYRYWGFLPTVVKIKDLRVTGKVDFLLDTGAGEAILSERDAQRIGLNYRNFPRGKVARGVGGKAQTWRIDKDVVLRVPTVGGVVLPDGRVSVEGEMETVRTGIEVLEEPTKEKKLPSLLGLEFLEGLNAKLIYDMPTKSIFLEI